MNFIFILYFKERNRMAVFQEGGLQALNTLITSDIDEVASQACEAFSHLSHDSIIIFSLLIIIFLLIIFFLF